MMTASKMWPLECLQGFLLIWPGDLVLDPKWPSFEFDLELIKTNILSKTHDDCLKKCDRYSDKILHWFGQVTQFLTPGVPVSKLT